MSGLLDNLAHQNTVSCLLTQTGPGHITHSVKEPLDIVVTLEAQVIARLKLPKACVDAKTVRRAYSMRCSLAHQFRCRFSVSFAVRVTQQHHIYDSSARKVARRNACSLRLEASTPESNRIHREASVWRLLEVPEKMFEGPQRSERQRETKGVKAQPTHVDMQPLSG